MVELFFKHSVLCQYCGDPRLGLARQQFKSGEHHIYARCKSCKKSYYLKRSSFLGSVMGLPVRGTVTAPVVHKDRPKHRCRDCGVVVSRAEILKPYNKKLDEKFCSMFCYNKLMRPKRVMDSFFNSWEWRSLRYTVLKKYGSTCMCCGAKRSDGVRMHVDHIKPRSRYPELSLKFSNLQVLCEDCNVGKSNKHEDDFRNLT